MAHEGVEMPSHNNVRLMSLEINSKSASFLQFQVAKKWC